MERENIVLEGLDHREVAYHQKAFDQMHSLITGAKPEHAGIRAEDAPVLDGMVSGYENAAATNQPLSGARVQVFEIEPDTGERKGSARHDVTTGADGRWGPFTASASAYYEWVVTARGYPVTHVFRTPFARSSGVVHLRLEPTDVWSAGRPGAGSLVMMSRPRGYLGHGRDVFTMDGKIPEGVGVGVPVDSKATAIYPAKPSRSIGVVLNNESMTVRTFPFTDNHVVIAEFHY